jgi:hypothetical protein
VFICLEYLVEWLYFFCLTIEFGTNMGINDNLLVVHLSCFDHYLGLLLTIYGLLLTIYRIYCISLIIWRVLRNILFRWHKCIIFIVFYSLFTMYRIYCISLTIWCVLRNILFRWYKCIIFIVFYSLFMVFWALFMVFYL